MLRGRQSLPYQMAKNITKKKKKELGQKQIPWMVAESPSNRMISPIRLSCPTRTSSYIAAPAMPSAMTTGPDTCQIIFCKCKTHNFLLFF